MNFALLAGIDFAIAESVKLLPGGVIVAKATEVGAKEIAKRVAEYGEDKRLKNLGPDALKSLLRDKLKILAVIHLFTDENLVRQLVPPGSEAYEAFKKEGFLASDGRIQVPPLPDKITGETNKKWKEFEDIISGKHPWPICQAVEAARTAAEIYKPG